MLLDDLAHQKFSNDLKISSKSKFCKIEKGCLKAYIDNNGKISITKHFTQLSNFQEITAEEAKQKHWGTTRSKGQIKNSNDLTDFFAIVFQEKVNIDFTFKQKEKVKKQIIRKKRKKNCNQNSNLKGKTEDELVLSYRNAKTEKEKNQIFSFFLYNVTYKNKNWHDIIWNYAYKYLSNLKQFPEKELNDLYQEGLMAFEKTIEKWYNVEKERSFPTHAIDAIESYIRRVFSIAKKIKRQSNIRNHASIEINDNYSDRNSYENVISTEDVGSIRTAQKNDNYEQISFYRDMLFFLNNMLKLKKINICEELYEELIESIKNKKLNRLKMIYLSKKYRIDFPEFLKIREKVQENFDKMLYKDIINFYNCGMKGSDEVLATKYNRSRAQITKTKDKLAKFAKKGIFQLNLTTNDIFAKG